MTTSPEETHSVWMETERISPTSELEGDLKDDVCVVGAGIAGLTVAYQLAREGRSVTVLEAGLIGSGQTQRSSAHLSPVLGDRYFHLESLHGRKGAKLAAESHVAAIDLIEEIIAREKIDCGFERVNGYLFVPPDESSDILQRELEAVHRAGLEAELVESPAALSFNVGPCLRFPKQAQFHPQKYLAGLARAIARMGGKIFTNTYVESFEKNRKEDLINVKTRNHKTVSAQELVVATNSPINDLFAIHTKQAAYRSYVVGALIPKGSVPKVLLWDTLDPYHYVRIESMPAYDILIVGGEDHKTGQDAKPQEHFKRLEAWASTRFPMIEKFEYRWSGQVMEPVDGLAFIGRNPMDDDNVHIVTGDAGNGLTHGTIAGILLSDLIQGRENPWEDLYDPSRISLRAVGTFTKENLNVASCYTQWMRGGDVESFDDIRAGEGAIVRGALKPIAAYRDEHGVLHEKSAVCPHLGCLVAWNTVEKTWDCPCHGSRFNCNGKVINGPAMADLAPVEKNDENWIPLVTPLSMDPLV